jgi:hypothetical protein
MAFRISIVATRGRWTLGVKGVVSFVLGMAVVMGAVKIIY